MALHSCRCRWCEQRSYDSVLARRWCENLPQRWCENLLAPRRAGLRSRGLLALAALLALAPLSACNRDEPRKLPRSAASRPAAPAASSAPAVEKPHHHHTAPHGGCLVVLGDEFAHVEFVLNAETGLLTAYVLDGEAERPLRIKDLQLDLRLGEIRAAAAPGKAASIGLKPVASALSGETVGDTSKFEGALDALKGAQRFEALLANITVRGREFRDVSFAFPAGNEHD